MAAGRSDMRPDRLAGEDENLTIWSDTETALFLKIWRRPDVQTALRQYTRKRPIWKKVSAELAAEGYRRSAEQCKSKMHNLMTSYRRVKKGLDPESRCKFFAIIDQVMTSAEFEAVAGPAGCAAEALDLDGETSEESGPSTSGHSDYAHSHSHSVSPGSREDSAADGERARCGPWRPVPVRLAEPAIFQATRERPTDECDQPPRKRYCNWEERYEADLAAARGVTGHPADVKRELSYMEPMAGAAASVERPPRPTSPQPLLEDMQVPRDLRVTSRSPPEPPTAVETRDLITARARQLLSVLPAHPQLAERDEPITNGQHREENGVHSLSGDDRTATSLERMETLLQELVDMQRAFLLSEERRRREQLVREENWRMQDKEFLVRLAQTLANSQH